MSQIHCVGGVCVDLLCGPIEQYPAPRVRAQTTAQWFKIMPGGGAANTPSALARLGLSISSFAKVGADLYGELICRELAKLGVGTAGIRTSDADSTPFTFVGIHKDGERTFIHTPGANRTFSLDDLDFDAVLACDYLLYHDLWTLTALDGKPAAKLLAEAQRRGVVTLLDEDFGYGPERESLDAMLPFCDYVVPSLDDVRALYGGASAKEVADQLLAQGARAVVLKMGGNGCLVVRGAERVRIPALHANVVDTTGAGDSWNAGFIAALSKGEDIVTAARIGNATSAFCIEAVGGSTGVPDYARVRDRAAFQAQV